MAGRGKGGCLTAVALVLSLMVLAVGAGLVLLVMTNGAGPKAIVEAADELEPRPFEEYTWEELSRVSALISEAPTDEEGRSVAASWNVEVGDARLLALDDGTTVEARVVGIRHDQRADGSGPAGITLMLSPISLEPINSGDEDTGGWEASELRSWLAGEGTELLPDDLAAVAVPVTKLTVNAVSVYGELAEDAAPTATTDTLWPFSVAEVCGPVTWNADEYGAYTEYVDVTRYDALLSAEGSQYAYFAESGVTSDSDPSHVLGLSLRGASCAWWYRTAVPYTYRDSATRYFYQVMSSGFPSSLSEASVPAGVVVGVCV